jgi:hypothetical protein
VDGKIVSLSTIIYLIYGLEDFLDDLMRINDYAIYHYPIETIKYIDLLCLPYLFPIKQYDC